MYFLVVLSYLSQTGKWVVFLPSIGSYGDAKDIINITYFVHNILLYHALLLVNSLMQRKNPVGFIRAIIDTLPLSKDNRDKYQLIMKSNGVDKQKQNNVINIEK